MRVLTLLFLLLCFSALTFAQAGPRVGPAYCAYGCGPYVPLVTTPTVSLQTASPSPAGASNATGGLQAGARNSTLSMMVLDPDAVYTQPVWETGGGSPLVSPSVRQGFAAHAGMHEEHAEHMGRGHLEEARESWTYFSGSAAPGPASPVTRTMKHAAHSYSNQDVERMNQNNGQVKYDSKTEKIQ